jgi:hypothetical protein
MKMGNHMPNTITFGKLAKPVAVLALCAAFAAAPALANGNGNGNGNGGGKSQGASHSEQASANAGGDVDGIPAKDLGKLNGFFHASDKALAHASPNSAIGKVAIVYAGLLEGYLMPPAGTTPPDLQEIAAALASAANKPLSAEIFAAVNARLAATNPDLASAIDAYPTAGTPYTTGGEALAAALALSL